jgi:Holliday junction resolvasome RuvABC ATP-dependent DNA helicase subunit
MKHFVESNPGLRSRFAKPVNFPDYSDEELARIFHDSGEAAQYHADEALLSAVRAFIAEQPRDASFGNGRLVRNLFEAAIARHASRLADVPEPTREQLCTLTAADIPAPDEQL